MGAKVITFLYFFGENEFFQISKTDVKKLHKVFAKYDYDLDEFQFEMAMSELDFSGHKLKYAPVW